MTFSHEAEIGSGITAAIESAAESSGAAVAAGGSFSGGFGGLDFASVSLSSLPFGGQDAGATVFIAEGSIVATAGSDFDIDDSDPFEGIDIEDDNSGSTGGGSSGSGGQADPTSTPFTIDPGFGGFFGNDDIANGIADDFESALTSALDIELELDGTVALGTDQITATVSFDILTPRIGRRAFRTLVGCRVIWRGPIIGSFTFGDSSTVQFQDANIGGLMAVGGTLAFTDGQIVAVISGTQ